ncbi:MAG: peroxiredoxin [Nocardioidaceae bacterium]
MAVALGQEAPGFALRNQHGQTVSLADFRGTKNVVVLFYPWAFSRVCSGELVQIRDSTSDLSNETSELVAISCDAMYSLRVLADRDGLRFTLLSDFWPHGGVARSYGIFDETLGIAGRSTFIVDRDGIVRWQVSNAIGEARDLGAYRTVLGDLA